jgi:hypothetical protein
MTDDELIELLMLRLKCLEKNSQLKKKYQRMSLANCSSEFSERYSPKRWMRTRWANDPYCRGAYSYVPRGLSTESSQALWEELGRPENEYLWFAGEATMTSSLSRSSVHGAWLSGIRAAEGIADSLLQPIYTPGYRSFPFPPAQEPQKTRGSSGASKKSSL